MTTLAKLHNSRLNGEFIRQPGVGKAENRVIGDDDMVQHPELAGGGEDIFRQQSLVFTASGLLGTFAAMSAPCSVKA